ncbi:MAG: hypothetical protein SGI83_12965 [Bacteroidota bacterium]|nr:hypothetical protein [Bacteroidota bacterium]
MINFLIYIDPGSGSFLVQAIIAAVLGISFFFKNIWAFIKSIFSGNTGKTDDNQPK